MDILSRMLGIPASILKNKLNRDAITRIDYFPEYTTIFLRDARLSSNEGNQDIRLSMYGLLILCQETD